MKKNRKIDWITIVWLISLVAIFFLLGRLSAEVPLLANAQEVRAVPEQQNYEAYCEEIGEKYNICPELLEAMIERESKGDPNVVSQGGDIGLLQVNPRWHRDTMDKLGVKNLRDPYGNIMVAADYLANLFEQYEDLPMVLMVYNGSSDAKERWISSSYTDYANQIMNRAVELERLHKK